MYISTSSKLMILAMWLRIYLIGSDEAYTKFYARHKGIIDDLYDDVSEFYEVSLQDSLPHKLRKCYCGCGTTISIVCKHSLILSSCPMCSDTIDTHWVLNEVARILETINEIEIGSKEGNRSSK